jgi:hypothetical protein
MTDDPQAPASAVIQTIEIEAFLESRAILES